jgi:hypothetical protein
MLYVLDKVLSYVHNMVYNMVGTDPVSIQGGVSGWFVGGWFTDGWFS